MTFDYQFWFKVELKIENSDIEYNNKPFNIKWNIWNKTDN